MDLGGIIISPFICIGWLIVGALAGAIARNVMGSKDSPLINDIILGLIGALVGGFVASLLGFSKPDSGIPLVLVNLVLAIIGASIIIFIGRTIRGRR